MEEKKYTLKELYQYVTDYSKEAREEGFDMSVGDFVDWVASRDEKEDCTHDGNRYYIHTGDGTLVRCSTCNKTIEKHHEGRTYLYVPKDELCLGCLSSGLAVKATDGLCSRHKNDAYWLMRLADEKLQCSCKDIKRPDGSIERYLCKEHAERLWSDSSDWLRKTNKQDKPVLPEKMEIDEEYNHINEQPSIYNDVLIAKTVNGIIDYLKEKNL